MSRGLGSTQRAILDAIAANPQGLFIGDVVRQLHGDTPTRAQEESVRRAIHTLGGRGLVGVERRMVTSERRSRKRIFELAACRTGFCEGCATRTRRMRLQHWHQRLMRSNALHDPGWRDELAAARASGFAHYSASPDRLVSVEPQATDRHTAWRQVVVPAVSVEPLDSPQLG